MNHPDSGAWTAPPAAGTVHTGPSPFTGLDVCAQAGLKVRPGGRTVMFTDDVWRFADVADLPVQMGRAATRLDFTAVRDPRWRLVAKEYLFARIAPRHERVAVLPHGYRIPLTLWSALARLDEVTRWLNWLHAHKIESLGEITQDHCDRYLAERSTRRDRAGAAIGTFEASTARLAAAVIIELALYSELFTTDRYTEGFTPWNGRSSSQVAGMRPPAQNKTPVLDQRVLQPMLAAALYLTATLGPHTVELARQVRERREQSARLPETRIRLDDLTQVLTRHAKAGLALEAARDVDVRTRLVQGWDRQDPLLGVSTGALAHECGVARLRGGLLVAARPLIAATAALVGVEKPWGRRAAPVLRADDQDTAAWTLPLDEREVRDLVGYLHTACLLTTATVTGMRASELMELRTGCRSTTGHAPDLVRHRLTSRIIKGQPRGGTVEEWVVIGEVDQAVALAEQLTTSAGPDPLVFGRFQFDVRYRCFRQWVNSPAGQRLGLTPIPEGAVNPRTLRRTLAHELAYRPGGLLATKIALKHVSVATTEGYANRPGGAQAKLLAEISEHETERNLGLVLAEYTNYRNGVMPAGPGARELIQFFDTVDADLPATAGAAPNVIAGDQHVLNLLSKRAQTLHLAAANYCWFADPSRALCLKLAGTPTAQEPLAGMCDSARCPQATHHLCHRPVWADTVANTTAFLGSLGRIRRNEQARLHAELDRATHVLAAIDTARNQEHPNPCA